GDLLAEVQHQDAVRDADDGMDVVLDHENRHAGIADGPDELHRLPDLRGVQASHHFIQAQDLRLGRQGPGDLQSLQFPDRERPVAPTRQEKSVVLPAPFGPMTPKISPGKTSKSTPASAWRPP